MPKAGREKRDGVRTIWASSIRLEFGFCSVVVALSGPCVVACVGVTAVRWARLGKGKVEREVATSACYPSGLHLSFPNSRWLVEVKCDPGS